MALDSEIPSRSNDVYVKDLSEFSWKSSPEKIVWRATLTDCSTSSRAAWSFPIAEIRRSFPEYMYNSYVVCGIRIRPSIALLQSCNNGAAVVETTATRSQCYSVFLRKNNLSFMGIPGDFSIATEEDWCKFSYPLPMYFLSKTQPTVFVEREMSSLEMRQMRPRPEPIIEIVANYVKDVSVSNYVFVMMDGLNKKVVIRNIFAENKVCMPEYYQSYIPGPLKVIPSWQLIQNGWLDTELYHRGASIEHILYLANNQWLNTENDSKEEYDDWV